MSALVLTPLQVALLAAVQNRLIPPDGHVPGAGDAGCAERVDGYLVERREWRTELLAALQAVDVAAARIRESRSALASAELEGTGFLNLSADERDAALTAVQAEYPRLFARLLRLTYTAYYTDPGVRSAAGFEADPPQPGGYGTTTFDEARLEPVRQRGKLWRDA
ncbi:MAG TPA: gluconate 2-dehydrogenase subunit 3 family protein [Chloroflexota bacterium]|nr:gluconate 2-dehydrogenase subunit 3 family protein [Chloroflexota bacterium]